MTGERRYLHGDTVSIEISKATGLDSLECWTGLLDSFTYKKNSMLGSTVEILEVCDVLSNKNPHKPSWSACLSCVHVFFSQA